MDAVPKLIEAIISGGSPSLLAIATVLILIWQATGFATNRQWFLAIPYLGFIGMASFLVNPVADSQSSDELVRAFSSSQLLQNLCITQVIIVAAAFSLNLKAIQAREKRAERWWLLAGICLVLPSPILITSVLAIEHRILSDFVGARPEVVGLWAAIGGIFFAASCVLLASCLPQRSALTLHVLTSFALLVVVILFPTTIQDIPNLNNTETVMEHLLSFIIGLAISFTIVGIGFVLERRRWKKIIKTQMNL